MKPGIKVVFMILKNLILLKPQKIIHILVQCILLFKFLRFFKILLILFQIILGLTEFFIFFIIVIIIKFIVILAEYLDQNWCPVF